MAGNEPARVLDPEMALGERLGKIAQLGGKAKGGGKGRDQSGRSMKQRGGRSPDQRRAGEAANEAGPALVGADAGCKARASHRAAHGVSSDVTCPDHGQQPDRQDPPGRERYPEKGERSGGDPERAEGSPQRIGLTSHAGYDRNAEATGKSDRQAGPRSQRQRTYRRK